MEGEACPAAVHPISWSSAHQEGAGLVLTRTEGEACPAAGAHILFWWSSAHQVGPRLLRTICRWSRAKGLGVNGSRF